jgi:hypothetical protein
MKKRVSAALAASFALMALASTAGATITITQAPAGPGYQNLSPWSSTGVCGGQGGTYSASGAPIRLGFGWFANNQGGLKQFFQSTSGTVDITGTDTAHDAWAATKNGGPPVSQQGITWTSGEPNTGTTPGGQTVKGVAGWYRGVLSLAPGTYTLRVAFNISGTINDGWDNYSGTIDNGNGCTFTVTA